MTEISCLVAYCHYQDRRLSASFCCYYNKLLQGVSHIWWWVVEQKIRQNLRGKHMTVELSILVSIVSVAFAIFFGIKSYRRNDNKDIAERVARETKLDIITEDGKRFVRLDIVPNTDSVYLYMN